MKIENTRFTSMFQTKEYPTTKIIYIRCKRWDISWRYSSQTSSAWSAVPHKFGTARVIFNMKIECFNTISDSLDWRKCTGYWYSMQVLRHFVACLVIDSFNTPSPGVCVCCIPISSHRTPRHGVQSPWHEAECRKNFKQRGWSSTWWSNVSIQYPIL